MPSRALIHSKEDKLPMNILVKKTLIAAGLATASMTASAEIIINQLVKGAKNTHYAIELKNVGDEAYDTATKLKLFRYTLVEGAKTNKKTIAIKNLTIDAGGILILYPAPSESLVKGVSGDAPLAKSGTTQLTDANIFELVEEKKANGETTLTVFDVMTDSLREGINLQRLDSVVAGQKETFNSCEWTASYTTERDDTGAEVRVEVGDTTERVNLADDIITIGLGSAAVVDAGDNAYSAWNASCFSAAAPTLALVDGTEGVVSFDEAQDGVTVAITLGNGAAAGDTLALTLSNDKNDQVTDIAGNTVPADWNGTDVINVTIPYADISIADDDFVVNYSVTAAVADSDASSAVNFGVNLTPPNVVSATIVAENTVSEADTITLSGASSTGEELSYMWSVAEANGLELTMAGTDTDTLSVTAPIVAEDTDVTLKLTVMSGEQTEEAVHTVTITNQQAITAQDITIDTVANTGLSTGAGDYFTAADTAVLSLAAANTIPGLTIMADGSYSFDPSDAAYASMVQGDAQSLTATVTATDQFGGEATATFTVNVRGVVQMGEQENSDAGSFGGMMALLMLPMAWLRRRRS